MAIHIPHGNRCLGSEIQSDTEKFQGEVKIKNRRKKNQVRDHWYEAPQKGIIDNKDYRGRFREGGKTVWGFTTRNGGRERHDTSDIGNCWRGRGGVWWVGAVGKVTISISRYDQWDTEGQRRAERLDASAGSSGVWWGVVLFQLLSTLSNPIYKLEAPPVTVTQKLAAVTG